MTSVCWDSDWYHQNLFSASCFILPLLIPGEASQLVITGDQKDSGEIPWITCTPFPHFGLRIDLSPEEGKALFVIMYLPGCHSEPNWTLLNFILFLLVMFLGPWDLSMLGTSAGKLDSWTRRQGGRWYSWPELGRRVMGTSVWSQCFGKMWEARYGDCTQPPLQSSAEMETREVGSG